MAINQSDLLQGTLDLLILRILISGDRHGYAIAKRIEQVSGDVFVIQMGSLYPALQRLQAKGFVVSEWGISETKRKAKFYTITDDGKQQVEKESTAWEAFAIGINKILQS